MKSVSILGCGWLGLPLAQKLHDQNFIVKGSTTSEDKIESLKNKGIQAFNIQLPERNISHEFFKSDYLVINIPPKTSKEGVNYHFESIKSIIENIPVSQKIIYVSATSVYPKLDKAIDENHDLDKEADRAKALIQTEELLLKNFQEKLTIVRFGGLLGYDRIPGKYFSGKTVEQHQQKVNYIHRDDAVNLLIEIISQEKWGYIFNGVAPKHPTKKEVYIQNAKDFDFQTPEFKNNPQELTNRFIESSRIELNLDYSFIYPDPLHFFYTN
jgi:nucleoside-diphosphate-sugar epimerase